MNKRQFLALVEKQGKGETTPEENELIARVYDQLQERKQSWEMDGAEEKAIMYRIKNHIEQRIFSSDRSSFPKQFSTVYWKIAAGFFLVFTLSYLFYFNGVQEGLPEMVVKSTGERQKGIITLSDGTLVYLNVNSRIRFPENFSAEIRRVELEGEAFFEVAPDKKRPFLVESQGVSTRVLGTSFNIKAQQGRDVEIAVMTGKVGVFQGEDNEEKQLVLSPNQKATVHKNSREMSVDQVDMGDYLVWRAKNINFNLISFDQVIEKLGNVYNLNIELRGFNKEECMIKASYSNRSLYTVMFGLKNLVDFEYEKIDDKNMVIHYKSCKN